MRKPTRRGVVISLALFSGLAGELVAFASMTRIAGPAELIGGRLGFPILPFDLRWTLFAVVSIAGWAGAILWTTGRQRLRSRGQWINLGAAAVAGSAVGLDHAVHSYPVLAWRITAFLVGVAMPLFSSIMVHLIAGMVVDQPAASKPRAPRNTPAGVPEPARPAAAAAGPPAPVPAAANGQVIPIGAPRAGRFDVRSWLEANWTDQLNPVDLRAAAKEHGVEMTRSTSSRLLKRYTTERVEVSG